MPAPVPLPSLSLIVERVASERETMNSHAESLDTKAGVVLGFAGVLVGLGATAQTVVSNKVPFQVGLGIAVLSVAWRHGPSCRAATRSWRCSSCARAI